jgi:hypothetical protein
LSLGDYPQLQSEVVKQRNVFILAIVLIFTNSIAIGSMIEKFTFPETQTGVLVGSCGSFDVLTDYTAIASGTIRYDKTGTIVETIQHYNLIGESIYYNSTNRSKSAIGQ